MLVKCPECNTLLEENTKTCGNCGFPLSGSEPKIETKICKECKHEVIATATECPYCGYPFNKKMNDTQNTLNETKVSENEQAEELKNDIKTESENSVENIQRKTSKAKKLWVIIGGCVIAALIVAVCIFLFGNNETTTLETESVYVSIGANGDAYFETKNAIVTIAGEFVDGISSPSQTSFVLIDKNDDMYYYELSEGQISDGQMIASEVYSINKVTDTGCIFTTQEDANNDMYPSIYIFEKNETVNLSITNYWYAHKTLKISGIDTKGKLVLYDDETNNIAELCSTGVYAEVLAVSNDGSFIIWQEEVNSELVFYGFIDGDKQKLGSLGDCDGYSVDVGFINDETGAVICATDNEKIIIAQKSTEPVVVNLGAELTVSWLVYDTFGTLLFDSSKEISGIYCYLNTDDYELVDLFYIDLDGNKEKVLSDINIMDIQNGKIAYINSDDELYFAEINEDKLVNESKITFDAESVVFAPDNRHLYINKDDGLYYVDLSDRKLDTEKITENMDSCYMTNKNGELYLIKDAENIEDSYFTKGELYRYTVGGELEKVTSDVIEIVAEYPGIITTDVPIVHKYSHIDENDDIIYDIGIIMNGEYEKCISGVIY